MQSETYRKVKELTQDHWREIHLFKYNDHLLKCHVSEIQTRELYFGFPFSLTNTFFFISLLHVSKWWHVSNYQSDDTTQEKPGDDSWLSKVSPVAIFTKNRAKQKPASTHVTPKLFWTQFLGNNLEFRKIKVIYLVWLIYIYIFFLSKVCW